MRTGRVRRDLIQPIVRDPRRAGSRRADARIMRGRCASRAKEGRFSGFVPGSAVLE